VRFQPISDEEFSSLAGAAGPAGAAGAVPAVTAVGGARRDALGDRRAARGFVVRSPGLLSSVQGSGRIGYQRSGLAEGGALDPVSLAIANGLVGNEPGEAGIEMTLSGAEFEFSCGNIVAVAGADMEPRLNGAPAPMYEAFAVNPGDLLSFGSAVSGCRAYLALAGGIDLPLVMGSKSTNLSCGIGGFEGRALKAGDELGFSSPLAPFMPEPPRLAPPEDFSSPLTILRVIPGPQADRFTKRGLDAFYGEEYRVGSRSDRMGSVLEGAMVEAKSKTDIVSDGIALGAVQIPSGGKPIVMLADRQTTGGYAKIACVIDADIRLLAQRKSGDRIAFRKTSLAAARRACLREERRLRWITRA
jgi:biotin-dependent carboxylase-like uncharacterized protein